MKPTYTILALCIAGALASAPLHAQTQRDLGSHQHGSASLNVVVDGSIVYIEFESPWANLTGFEHSPSTDQQQALLTAALEQLDDADSLFKFTGGEGCTGETTSVVDTLSSKDSHEEHDEHDEHEDSHADLLVNFAFECVDIDEVDQLTVNLFDYWPGIETLSGQLVTASQQSAFTLSEQSNTIDLAVSR